MKRFNKSLVVYGERYDWLFAQRMDGCPFFGWRLTAADCDITLKTDRFGCETRPPPIPTRLEDLMDDPDRPPFWLGYIGDQVIENHQWWFNTEPHSRESFIALRKAGVGASASRTASPAEPEREPNQDSPTALNCTADREFRTVSFSDGFELVPTPNQRLILQHVLEQYADQSFSWPHVQAACNIESREFACKVWGTRPGAFDRLFEKVGGDRSNWYRLKVSVQYSA